MHEYNGAIYFFFLFNSRQTWFYDCTVFVFYIWREILKEEMITYKPLQEENWKLGGKNLSEKKKKETDELMTTLSKNDPISEQVILNDHILQKCSFMNKVWIKEL